ncbi:MAG: hypothetical protein ACOZCL_09005 [Bacillota bacterium]
MQEIEDYHLKVHESGGMINKLIKEKAQEAQNEARSVYETVSIPTIMQ